MLITDDDILAAADQLAQDQDLDDDQRNAVVLAMQRLVWPPSPWPFLHDLPHAEVVIGQRTDGGWHGELLCPHGCVRVWTVQKAHSEEAVYGALTAAHQEYRTGRVTASVTDAPHPTRSSGFRVSLDSLLNRAEYVEVTDRRLDPEGTRT